MVVESVGSELIISPFRLQVMERGLSPLEMAHISCAESPWFTGSSPKEKATICGTSVNRNIQCLPAVEIPLTVSSAECADTPAGFSALQV